MAPPVESKYENIPPRYAIAAGGNYGENVLRKRRASIRLTASPSSAASQHSIVYDQVDYFYNGETAAADQQSKVSAHITYKQTINTLLTIVTIRPIQTIISSSTR